MDRSRGGRRFFNGQSIAAAAVNASVRRKKEFVSLTTLGAVLLNADELSLDAVLFLPYGEVWNSTTQCAVIAVDRYADEDHVPDLAAQNNLERALQIAQVLDVVVNARQQRNQLTVENLVTAFLFYYDRDAFIIFDLIDEQ